jgi:dTDP-4-dehydrorhamnose 3,5-epimerase
MNVIKTPIQDLLVIEPKIFEDSRGYFVETFNSENFIKNVFNTTFVQDNESCSSYGVLRGLHFQKGKHAQAKLVRVVEGSVLDVAVDLRKNSKHFGEYYSIELSAENKKQLFIPRGFAHGFVVLSERSIFSYKCDNFYDKDSESGLRFNDPDINIDWKIDAGSIIINDRDNAFPSLKELRSQIDILNE